MSTIDQQRQGPSLGDAALGWLALWDEAAEIHDRLPAADRKRITDAGHGLDVLPAAFATIDPVLRAEVHGILREMVAVLTGDCGVSRLPERFPPGCGHRRPER